MYVPDLFLLFALRSRTEEGQTLNQEGFEVDLYEKEDRIGGDAHTIEHRRMRLSLSSESVSPLKDDRAGQGVMLG
jgi:hypothetical protein